jgi:hypothetical protein
MIDARFLGLTANQLGKVATDLKADNERLKALVRDMWWTMVKAAWDDEQPSLSDIRERMDEAGVEPY